MLENEIKNKKIYLDLFEVGFNENERKKDLISLTTSICNSFGIEVPPIFFDKKIDGPAAFNCIIQKSEGSILHPMITINPIMIYYPNSIAKTVLKHEICHYITTKEYPLDVIDDKDYNEGHNIHFWENCKKYDVKCFDSMCFIAYDNHYFQCHSCQNSIPLFYSERNAKTHAYLLDKLRSCPYCESKNYTIKKLDKYSFMFFRGNVIFDTITLKPLSKKKLFKRINLS